MILDTAQELAMDAVQHWDCIIGSPVFVMHRENAVFKIETKFGFAALRIHRPGYHGRVEIESELMWMAHLVQSGLQVPTPILTRQGSYVAEVGNTPHIVDLLLWLDGAPLGKSGVPLTHIKEKLDRIFFNVGQTLAHMHIASDQWILPSGFQRHALNKEGLVGETAAWGRFWEATCLNPNEKALMRDARNLAAQKLDDLATSGASYGLIHADLVRENILITDKQIRFIDFDDAGFGFRMFDLAVALIKNREEPHYESIRSKLFEGYKSVKPLSSEDENSLGLFLALRDFAYLGWADARKEEPTIVPRLLQIKDETVLTAKNFLQAR
jgi:Ser/Thr protein kinase RdoA (MazF antagonist)